jgi:DNA-binding MarR family transcriptional regulator
MDYVRELGSLALVSRLRRLLDELQRQGKRVYADLGIDLEIRWFAVFHFVAKNPGSIITVISRSLHLQHPTVVQVVNEMTGKGLLQSESDPRDRRRRKVSLTPEGRKLFNKLQPVWRAFEIAGREILEKEDNDLIGAIDRFESALSKRSLYDRIHSRLKSLMEDN